MSFEEHEAVVTYDPSRCSVNDLIAAVAKTEVPATANRFGAKLKNPSSRL